MSETLKRGYIALCVISILNFIYDNYTVIARTHIGQVSTGLLGKVYDFIVGLDGTLLILFAFLPLIVSIVVSVIVFVFYRKSLTKPTAVLATLGFVPYLLFNISTYCSGMGIIIFGIIKVIYAIIMIVFMLKNIKKLSV
ncbi:MAG: hypothetical protein IKW45_07880 [Clostridia bacterium]|nr:hypothetical protein [Clostridia bacterium]